MLGGGYGSVLGYGHGYGEATRLSEITVDSLLQHNARIERISSVSLSANTRIHKIHHATLGHSAHIGPPPVEADIIYDSRITAAQERSLYATGAIRNVQLRNLLGASMVRTQELASIAAQARLQNMSIRPLISSAYIIRINDYKTRPTTQVLSQRPVITTDRYNPPRKPELFENED